MFALYFVFRADLASPFTISVHQDQVIFECYVVKKIRATDHETQKLRKGRSGTSAS